MKQLRKTAALLLLVSLLLPLFASCSEKTSSESESTAPQSTAAAPGDPAAEAESEEEAEYLDARFKNVTFDGMTYAILTDPSSSNPGVTSVNLNPRFGHEEMTGEPVDDAIYQQVVTVEDHFNVDIEHLGIGSVVANMTKCVQSGDNSYSVAIGQASPFATLVTQNCLLDLNNFDEIYWDRPWWNKSYKEKLTVGGKTYLAFGDFFFESAIANVHLFFFNKDMCDTYGVAYPYEDVLEGKWTMDYVKQMITGVRRDLNGDGQYNENDEWGLVQSPIQSSILFYTASFHVVSFDDEGYPYLDMYSDALATFYDDLYRFDFETPEIWTNTQAQELQNFKMFAEGQVMLSSYFLTGTSTLRSVEFEVGILPYPKWREEDPYVNWPMGSNYVLGSPVTIPFADYDFIGTITEALAAEGNRFVRPALYEITLQGKLARDPESQVMLDLIFDTLSVDFGWIHTDGGGMGWFVNTCLNSKLPSISSVYAKMEKRAKSYYEKIVDYYRSNE